MQAIVFGIVQGVTEFLPISSSGHIVLAQYFFGIEDPQMSFVFALHMGSLLAVVMYFWRDWLNLVHIKKDMKVYQDNPHLLWLIVVATIPSVAVGLFIGDFVENLVFSKVVVAFLILCGSVVLFVCDRIFSKKRTLKHINVKNSFIIGLFQIVALIPGVSRSGMTISGARMCGFNRVDAARFSFLISVPIIIGAGILMIKSAVFSEFTVQVFVGTVASFIVSICTIHYFLALIRKVSYAIFLYYSIVFFIITCCVVYLG